MTDLIKIIVSAVGGAIVGGFFNVWLQKIKNQGSNEGVYADHTKELLERVDKLTDERDDLKQQVINLQSKIDDQNDTIIEGLNLIDVAQLTIIAILCYVLTNSIKNTKTIDTKWMPFIWIALGLILAIVTALVFKDKEIGKVIIAGLLIGGWTSGMFDEIQGFLNEGGTSEWKK